MHERWEEWMMQDGIINGKAKELSCKQVVEWLVNAYTNTPEQVGKNAWMKSYCAWF